MKRWLILFAVCLLLPACSSDDPVGPCLLYTSRCV